MRIGIINDMALAREAPRRVVVSVPGHRVAWGLPRAAVEIGAACKVLPVSEIGPAVVGEVSSRLRNER
jgi:hypothetical protein